MNIKKVSLVAGIALAIYLVVNDPQGAAGAVRGVVFWLRSSAEALVVFIRSLFGG